MRIALTISLFFCIINLYSQEYCIPGRFSSTPLFDNTELTIYEDVIYGEDTNWNGNTQSLYMDLYFPDFNYDILLKRPLLVFLPGGGYIIGEKEYFATEALELAKRGFVCASIDYRTGWAVNGSAAACNGDSTSLIKANYRACQDIRASLRYLVNYTDSFGIDTNYIYLIGSSAGSIAGLMSHFMNSYDFDSLYPSANLINSLGMLDSATNTYNTTYNISGIISLWGGIPDVNFINELNSIPMLLMHGLLDQIVPFHEGQLYSCPEYFYLYGPGPIVDYLSEIEECYELNYQINGGHGIYDSAYRIERMHTFLKQLFCDSCLQDTIIDQNTNTLLANTSISLFDVYPNPTNGIINISGLADNNNLIIEIVNIYGSVVEIREEIIFSSTAQINMKNLDNGIYILNIYNKNNKIYHSKIIKL